MKLPEEKQPHSMSQYRRLKSQGADVEEPEENTQTKELTTHLAWFVIVCFCLTAVGAMLGASWCEEPETVTVYVPQHSVAVMPVAEEPLDMKLCGLVTVECPHERIEELIRQIGADNGLSEYEIEKFVDIAWCESTFNPLAVSQSGSFHGLYQLHSGVWDFDTSKVYDARYNTEYAMTVIYPSQGWSAWPVCSQ